MKISVKKLNTLILTFLLLFTGFSFAYEIGPLSQDGEDPNFETVGIGDYKYEKNHEKLTALALQCLANANINEKEIVNKPTNCHHHAPKKEYFSLFFGDTGNYPNEIKQYKDLLGFVRWPDDPTRFIHDNKRSMGKFATLTKLGGCKQLKKNNDGELTLVNHGLFCNSHYGKLQFLHAMAEKEDQPAMQTRKRIDEWASFAFRVASRDIDITENYCDFWEDNKDYPILSSLILEQGMIDFNWCKERKGFWRTVFFMSPLPAWDVGTTFNLECKNPVKSGTCHLYSSCSDSIRNSALGSIIHLIQDSYSKAHTNRGSNALHPEVSCARVVQYRSYDKQDSDKHGESDKWPTFDQNCDGTGTLDPVTATAMVIWLLHNPDSTEWSIEKIIDQVLGKQKKSDAASSAGSEYQ